MPIGKIQPPTVGIQDEPTICVEINTQWASQLIGMINPAKYPEWWAGTLEENRFARAQVRELMYIISQFEECGDMAKDCCVPVQVTLRINPTTGLPEQSSNGGATWTPQAGGIQTVIYEPVPPVDSGVASTKCDAATNLYGQVSAWIDAGINNFDTATNLTEFTIAVLEAILIAVFAVLSLGALTPLEALVLPLIGAAAGAAWGAGKAAFVAYWTTDVRDKILCAAYCTIGENGSFNDAQFSAFWNKVNSDLPPSPAKILFMGFLSSVGRQGVNAMAASGLSSGASCASCICFEDCASHWSIFTDSEGHYHGEITEYGDGFIIAHGGPITSGNHYLLIRTANENQCCVVNSIEVLSGSLDGDFVGWTDCGTVPVEGAPQHSGLLSDTYCINYLQIQNSVDFEIKITFSECP